MFLNDSRALGTRYGVRASGGSQFVSNTFVSPNPSTIEGISRAAISLTGNASVYIENDHINGRIRLWEKSVATLNGVDQVNPSNNIVHSGSSLVARGSNSLDGDFKIREFSNLTLPFGSTISGGLSCELGADAFCDDPLGATTWSNCDQCPNPGPP